MNNIKFNQDKSCISVATDEGSRIYNCEPFGEIYNKSEATFLVKILFSTSLTIIIPKVKDNRQLKIYNLKQNLKICELIFPSSIIDVKINKKRLIVALNIGQIYIYDLSCVKLMKIIEIDKVETFVGDLSNDDSSLLVIPFTYLRNKYTEIMTDDEVKALIKFNSYKELEETKDFKGWVLLYDTINLKPKLVMKCHSGSVKKIIISNMVVGTASSKGTIIRLFYLQDLKLHKIVNLRRGHNIAKINCLQFNQDQSVLACGSESTIHFFNLKEEEGENPDHDYSEFNTTIENEHTEEMESSFEESSKLSEDLNENLANLLISKPVEPEPEKPWKLNTYTKKLLKKLPYKDYFNNLIVQPPKRSFNIIKLKDHKPIEIGFLDDLILIASYSGKFYQYKFDKGRECKLINELNL